MVIATKVHGGYSAVTGLRAEGNDYQSSFNLVCMVTLLMVLAKGTSGMFSSLVLNF